MKNTQETPAVQGPQTTEPPVAAYREDLHPNTYKIKFYFDNDAGGPDEPCYWDTRATDQEDALRLFYELHFNPEIRITAITKIVAESEDEPERLKEEKMYHFQYANEFGLYEHYGVLSHDYIAASDDAEAEYIFWARHRNEVEPSTGNRVRLFAFNQVGVLGKNHVFNPPKDFPVEHLPIVDYQDEPLAPWDLNNPHLHRLPDAIRISGANTFIRAAYASAFMLIEDSCGPDERCTEFDQYADAILQVLQHSMEYQLKYGAPVSRYADTELFSRVRDAAMFFRYLVDGDNGSWKDSEIVSMVNKYFGPDGHGVFRTIESF